MLSIAGLLIFCSLAINTNRLLVRDQSFLTEIGYSTTLGRAVWLYPAPALLSLFPLPWIALLAFGVPLSALLYVPGVVSANRLRRRLEVAGTDRADPLQSNANLLIYAGVLGMVAVGVGCLMYWLFASTRTAAL